MPAKCAAPRATAHLSQEYRTPAWEQRKVQDVADRFDNLRIPVAANLRVHGKTPYYGANGIQDYVDGFTHDGEFVLVAEDGANDLKNYPVKCVNGRIWVNNHAHVLQGKAGIADNSFLAFAISQSDIESLLVGGGRAKLNAETLMSIEFRLPCLQEQHQIGEYLTRLDHLITLHQRKYDKLCVLKKSMLDKMFPKGGSLYPEIRFAGFTDPWEQRKLGELYKEVSEKNDLTYGRDRIISVAHMYFNPVVYVTEDDYLKTYNVMRLGDIAFEGNRSKNFAHGRLVENTIGDGIVSHVFKVFRPIQPFDLMYWKYSINNEKAMKDVLTRSTKASTMMHELVAKDFLNEEIAVPSLEEQRRIGAFFDRLDSLITLHQRKLELLRNIKKSMLDKMFV